MRVAIYCRLSEEDRNKKSKDDDSESIHNQKTMLLKYAVEQDWDVVGIYSDMYNRILIQCLPHGSVEKWLKQRLSADLSRLPKAFFFVS